MTFVRHRRTRLGLMGSLVLASCFHSAKPSAVLGPGDENAGAARTRGAFAVVYAAPSGLVTTSPGATVRVLFSRSVRSVDMADDEHLPALELKTKAGAVVPGTWRWAGTRGVVFLPAGELPGGNDFTVVVPAGLRALDGAVLEHSYTLQFQTRGPQVSAEAIGPKGTDDRMLAANPVFRLQFDQNVNPREVMAATALRVSAGDGDRGESFAVEAAAPSQGSAVQATAGLGSADERAAVPRAEVASTHDVWIKPVKPLPQGRNVELLVSAALRGTGGPRPMDTAFSAMMRTHGPLRFADFYCPRVEANGRCRAGGDIKVVLSTPVLPDEWRRHVKLGALPPRPPQKGEKHSLDPSTEHWLGVAPKVGTSYKVTLTAGMRDIFGQKLANNSSFDFVVEAPFVTPAGVKPIPQGGAPADTEASETNGDAQADEPARSPAANPHDPRPRRERLPYRLDIGLTGQVLEASARTRLEVPIGAINVPTYATVASALSDAQAVAWTLSRGSTSDFIERNNLPRMWKSKVAATNERAVEWVDLAAKLAARHGRGPALLVAEPPQSPSGDGGSEAFVTVTDLGVTAKMSPYGGLVWVTQLSTGKPVSGAVVSLRTAKPETLFEGVTAADGLVTIPIAHFDPMEKGGAVRNDAAIVVRSGDDWTITKMSPSPVHTRLTAGVQDLSKHGRWAGIVFADRGVFRPGEIAKVSGIVRVVESGGVRSIVGRELRVDLKDSGGEQLFDGRVQCDEFGTFALDLPIPKSAKLGSATITAVALAGGKSNTAESGMFTHEIRVLAYKPNEFKVETESDKPWYVRGDEAVFTTRGDYLYGAPMADAAATTWLSRQEVPFSPPGSDGLIITDEVWTGDDPNASKAAAEEDSQDGQLDEHGRFVRKVVLSFAGQKRTERALFEVNVNDLSRRTVSARTTALVHPGEFYAALRAPADRFVAAGTMYHASVAAIDPRGAHRPGVKMKVELVERRWSSTVGEQPDGSTTHANGVIDKVVSACDVTSNRQLATCDLKVPRAGYFVLRASATDPRGNNVRASTSLYGTEDAPQAPTAWAADDRHGIKLEANKEQFEVGDTAKVLLRSPFQEGQALVAVERNGILWQNVVPIRGPLPLVEVPIRPEFYPNAYVTVVALRGRIQSPPASGADLGGPDYRYGHLPLRVNQEAHRLQVGVSSAQREYPPGAQVEADVSLTDRGGKAAPGTLTFYAVDEGVLALTSYKTPDPLPPFVEPRKLSVFTFDNRELLARILPMKAGERVASLGFEYKSEGEPGRADKGNYGGDGDSPQRADFRTTAFFEAGRRTDGNGKAHFSFKLPDNLTTFRLMAVAAAADDRFGSGEATLTTARRLMARPALPQTVRVGDALEASVIVSSKAEGRVAGERMNVEVRFTASGLTSTGPSTRSVSMLRGGQAEVRFPVKAQAPGEASLSFEVKGGGDSDRVTMKRQVELPVSVESAAVYGETSGHTDIALGDLSKMRADRGGLDVRVAATALVGIGASFDHLFEYPYGCTEQLTSRTLPLISLMDLAKDFGARLPADIDGTIDNAIEHILKRQNGDGGFGFWDGSPSESWLSAYAMLAVAGSASSRHFVPKDDIERGRQYLTAALARITSRLSSPTEDAPDDDEPRDDAQEHEPPRAERFAEGTFIVDTLATLGAPNPGAINVLYDAREASPLFARAALLHAMAKSDIATRQVRAIAAEVESELRVGPDEVDVVGTGDARFERLLDSRARTLAMVLRALLAVDPHHPLAARIARKLLGLRTQGSWRTTQEDAWALLALADYRRLQESGSADFDARVTLDGRELLSSHFAAGSSREDRASVAARELGRSGDLIGFNVSGHGKLYYAAGLKFASAALPTRARDEGFFVQKYVRGVTPKEVSHELMRIPVKTAASVDAGDLVLVDLLFESAEPRDHVVLDDPLPAGLEALDYDVDTTSRAQAAAEAAHDSMTDPKQRAWLGTTYVSPKATREVRDDRVVSFFDHVEPGMYRVHYLARATSLGSFVVPPTRIEAMYAPEVYGFTAASKLEVRAKK